MKVTKKKKEKKKKRKSNSLSVFSHFGCMVQYFDLKNVLSFVFNSLLCVSEIEMYWGF
jgi:hypothetical protein